MQSQISAAPSCSNQGRLSNPLSCQPLYWGPGYRVYYAIEGKRVILLCDGGDKRTQAANIEQAITRWQEWQQRGKK